MPFNSFSILYRKILKGQYEFKYDPNDYASVTMAQFTTVDVHTQEHFMRNNDTFSEYRMSRLRPYKVEEKWKEVKSHTWDEDARRRTEVEYDSYVEHVRVKNVLYKSMKIRNHLGGIKTIRMMVSPENANTSIRIIFNDQINDQEKKCQ